MTAAEDRGDGPQPFAWASEWQGVGGLAKALHLDKHEAHDNAKWMHGRSFPLFTADERQAAATRLSARQEGGDAILNEGQT